MKLTETQEAVTAFLVNVLWFLVLAPFLLQWLWSWSVVPIFKLPPLDFWQAWALLVISNMVFKTINSPTRSVSNG